jgi:hypothetical protein
MASTGIFSGGRDSFQWLETNRGFSRRIKHRSKHDEIRSRLLSFDRFVDGVRSTLPSSL